MVTKARGRYREEVRRTIIEAAGEAFAQKGYDGVSMRDIAERIGFTHATLYQHFKDKNALFASVAAETFDRLGNGLAKLMATSKGDSVRTLKKAARAYVDFGLENPAAYEFTFVLRQSDAPGKPHALYEHLRDLVERCIAERRFKRVDADEASQALWAAVHGVTSLLIARPKFPWKRKEALIQRVIDAAVNALANKTTTR